MTIHAYFEGVGQQKNILQFTSFKLKTTDYMIYFCVGKWQVRQKKSSQIYQNFPIPNNFVRLREEKVGK